MPSFILFIEASKEREHVNLYQIQNGFKVIDNFLVEKNTKNSFKVKRRYCLTTGVSVFVCQKVNEI